MIRKWKIVISVVFISLVARCSEPFVEEWYYKEACSFGSVSKEEYAKIRSKAKIVFQSWDWQNKISEKLVFSSKRQTSEAKIDAFLKINLAEFIPKTASADIKIAHLLAFMDGIGARLTYKYAARSKQYKNGIQLNYKIYRFRIGDNDLSLFFTKGRFSLIMINFNEDLVKSEFVMDINSYSLGARSGFKQNPDPRSRPLGCVNKGLFKYWSVKW